MNRAALKSILFATFLGGIALCPFVARADEPAPTPACESILTSTPAPTLTPSPAETKLGELPPLMLDIPTIREGVQRLIRRLVPLHGDFKNLDNIQQDLVSGRLTPELARQLLVEQYSHLSKSAEETLARYNGRDSNTRELLEGQKILLKRARSLMSLVDSVERQEIEKAADEPAHDETDENAGNADKTENANDQGVTQETPTQAADDLNSKDQLEQLAEKNLAQSAAQELERQGEQDIQQMSREQFDKLIQEAAKNYSQNKQSQKQQQAQTQNQQQQAQKLEERIQKESQEPKVAEARKDVLSQMMKEAKEDLQKKIDETKEHHNQERVQERAQEQSEQAEREKAESAAAAESGQSQDQDQNQQGNQSDGSSAGNGTGETSFGDDLASLMGKLKTKPADEAKSNKRKSSLDFNLKKTDEREQAELDAYRKTEQQLEPNATKTAKIEIDQRQKVELVSALLNRIWRQVLNSYNNSEAFFAAINQYITLANNYGAELQADSFHQQAAHALKFYHELQAQRVSYKNMEDLAHSLSDTMSISEKTHLLRKLKYLHILLKEKFDLKTLSPKETELFNIVTRLLADDQTPNATDEQIVSAFMNQLTGPLSYNAVMSKYGNANGEIDIKKLANDIRGNQLTDLVLYPKLEPYINILLNKMDVPTSSFRNLGPEVPVNNTDFELIEADELDQLPKFYRDGVPMKLDLYRLLSGDMLRVQYRDEVERFNPKKPKSKRVSVVLVDVSGSMGQQRKYILRNAIINAYLDKAQRETFEDGGQHVVYIVPFDDQIHSPTRLGSPADAQNYFNNLRENPTNANGGTSITNAAVAAYNMIEAEIKTGGGELETANILLLTDAEDGQLSIDQVAAARAQLPKDTKVKFNALTIGKYNRNLTTLVEMQQGLGSGELGEVYHQNIPYPELNQLLEKTNLELTEGAKFEGRTLKVSPTILNELTRAANAVASEFAHHQMDSTQAARSVYAAIEKASQNLKFNSTQPSGTNVNVNANVNVNGGDLLSRLFMQLPNKTLTQQWSSSERAEFLQSVAEQFALILKVNVSDVYANLNTQALTALKKWLVQTSRLAEPHSQAE